MASLQSTMDALAMRGTKTGASRMTAMDLQRVKGVLDACGVAEVHGSPHIYAHPESIHQIAPGDLSFLMAHAEALATHKDIRYDVRAFTGILWGMAQHAERQVARVMRLANLEAAVSLESMTDAASPSSSGASDTASATIAEHDGAISVQQLYTAMHANLLQVFRVTTLLRAFEDATARSEVRDARRVAQVDVDVMARLATLLTRLFLAEAGETPRGAVTDGGSGGAASTPLNVARHYNTVGHHLFRTTETALSSVMLLLASLAGRRGSDARPVLRYFHDVDSWKASALGLQVLESYGNALHQLLAALLRRRQDFNNVDEVTARLLLTRLATRPPYQWRTFRLLYFSVQELSAGGLGATAAAEERQGSSAFGQLLVFRRMQHVLQMCLTTDASDAPEVVATVKALRKAVAAQIQVDWQDKVGGGGADASTSSSAVSAVAAGVKASSARVLSYYELLVLAVMDGMPEADLTKDGDLVRRAMQTHLSEEAEVLAPSFLRLLLACCYTVPTSMDAVVPHSLLSTASTLALYDSLSRHLFQIPMCASAGTAGEVNQLYAGAGVRADTLVDLCVWNAVENTREDARAVQDGWLTGGGSPTKVPANENSEGETGAGPVPKPPSASTALFLRICRDVAILLKGNEDVLLNTPEAARSRAKNFPEGFRAITLTTVRLLFTALSTADLFHHIESTEMLPVVAQLFALRAYYPFSPSATEAQRKAAARLIALMQNTLASLPQQMTATTVNGLLRRQLVPMSTTVAQANGLQLAHFEAYLRAMATASAANAVTDALMLQHWVDVAVPAITNRHSAALANAGHDFFISAFRAEKYVCPLFVPTYIALYIPSVEMVGPTGNTLGRSSNYPPLSVPVVQHFARSVRASCHGIERCDPTALAGLFEEGPQLESAGAAVDGSITEAANSFLARLSATQKTALRKITPTSAVLLIVSALFDRLCLLWNSTPGHVKVARDLFMAYFSALCNLLQCTNTAVIQRVCASIEAIEVEHLRGSGGVQLQFLKYVSSVVDTVQGNSKVGIAEWFLQLNKRIQEQNYGKQSKL